MSDRFVHNTHGPNSEGLLPFPWGELGTRLTYCGLGQELPSYQVASWSIQSFGHNRRGPKIGGRGAVLLSGGSGPLSDTMSPGSRPTSVPSGVLIHPAVWPQHTWAENWGLCPFLGECPTQYVPWAEAYLRAKWHLDPSSRLAIMDMGR